MFGSIFIKWCSQRLLLSAESYKAMELDGLSMDPLEAFYNLRWMVVMKLNGDTEIIF